MFQWLDKIFDFLWQFIPKPCIVDTRFMALRWKTIRLSDLIRFKWDPSAKVEIVGPGFHLYWPLTTQLILYPVKDQTLPVVSVQFETEDGVTMSASAVLAYDVQDVLKLLEENLDADDGIADTARSVLLECLESRTREDLRKSRARLNNSLRLRAEKEMADRFGIRIRKFALDSLTQARIYRVIQSTRHEGELK